MNNLTDFWNKLTANIPDVIVALLVLVVAFLVAWIAKKLCLKLIKFTGIDKGMSKAGVEQKHISKTTQFLGQLVYLIVFMLFLPGVFEKLGLNNVATPIVSMANSFMTYLPNIIGALVIAMIGLFIAKLVKELLYPLFHKIDLNGRLARIGVEVEKVNIADVLATAVYVIIAVLFVVEALNTLQLDILTRIGNSIIDYLPMVISAGIILLLAFLFGNWAEKGLINKFKTSKFTAYVIKTAILVMGVFMTLYQLGVASDMVNAAFIIVLGAVAVAFAIAFGIGGRDFAAHTMKKFEKSLEDNSTKKQ